MVLNLFATLFVLALVFLHSIYGLYSGLMNLFCTLTALAVAFGFHETLNEFVVGTFHLPGTYTAPFAVLVPFCLTLLVLRLAADNLLRGNVRVPMYVDWGGAAVCGFVNAQICIGVLVLSFLMLPWGGRVMKYQGLERDERGRTYAEVRVTPELRRQDGRIAFHDSGLWLKSDRMAVGLFNLLSNGSLRGDTQFASVYPDFSAWVWWTQNQIQNESLTAPLWTEQLNGYENGINVVSWWDYGPEKRTPLSSTYTQYQSERPYRDNPKPQFKRMSYEVQEGQRLIGVRVRLLPASADRYQDSGLHRFRPTNLRVVGDVVFPDGSRAPRHYFAQVLGGAELKLEPPTDLRIVDPDSDFSLPDQVEIDAYFEVDRDFAPRFVEYRRYARAPLTAAQLLERPPTEPATASPTPGPAPGPRPAPDEGPRGGPTSFIDTVNKAGNNDKLPFSMSQQALANQADIPSGKLASIEVGRRIAGPRTELEGRGPGSIRELQVPEGKWIFQVEVSTKKMGSLPGQVINFVTSTMNVYWAVDVTGGRHLLAGFYAIVQRDGQPYVELFFTPDPESVGFRGQLEVDQATRRALRDQDDAVLGLLFVVPKGACIKEIDPGGRPVTFPNPVCE